MKNLLQLSFIILFIGCDNTIEINLTPVSVIAPIYAQLEIGDIISEGPRVYDNLFSYEYYKEYILFIEYKEGIHVIDNTVPDLPEGLAFLVLPGITSFEAKEDFLVVSLANHIITIDFTDPSESIISGILRLEQSPNGTGLYPNDPNFSGRFECVDLSKGIVAGWERKEVIDPRCEKYN
ncbi:MAG: hypothetical protein ACJA1A_002550 [Saprospiraceae bacterium]|jgi:hypothetical protein